MVPEFCSPNGTFNFSNIAGDLENYIYLPNREWILKQTIWPCLIVFGLLSNFSFIWTFALTPSLHTATYVYLINLACTDILTLLIYTIPIFHPVQQSLVYSNGNLVLSKMSSFSKLWLLLCSIECVGLVSIERFLAVCYPIKHRHIKGYRNTVKAVCLMWFFSLACAATAIPFFSDSPFIECLKLETGYYFTILTSDLSLYGLSNTYFIIFAVFYMMSWPFMVFCNLYMYTRIMKTLNDRRSNRMLDSMSNNMESQFRQVAVMLIANGLLFYLLCTVKFVSQISTTLPLFGLNTLTPYQSIVWFDFEEISVGLNASINPLVYTLTNQRYRRAFGEAFKNIFGRCRLNQQQSRRNEIKCQQVTISNRN